MARLWKRKDRNGKVRYYADLRDYADVIDTRPESTDEFSPRMALKPSGASQATEDEDVARKLLSDAVAVLEKRRRGRGLGVEPASPGMTLGKAAEIHLLEKAQLEDVTDDWLAESENMLSRALEFFGEGLDVASLEPSRVRDWIKHLGTVDNGRGGTLSGGTIRHHINVLSNFFGTALEKGWAKMNPVAALRRGTKPSATTKEADWFEPPEAALILEAAFRYKSTKAYQALTSAGPLVATYLLTGGRRTEVLGLMAEDVIFDRDLVHFRPNQHRRLKTRNATRTVRLWPQLKEILQEHVFGAGHVSGLLFPSPGDPSKRRKGAPMVTDLEEMLDGVAEVLGWEKGSIRSKAFRHTYCSARLQTVERVKIGADGAGNPIMEAIPVSPFTVAKEMGHGGDSLVKRVYGHLGTVRQRTEVVEFRADDHAELLGEQLARVRAWSRPQCRAVGSSGKRCGVRENLSEDGLCFWHDPKRREEAREARPHASRQDRE